MAYSQIRCGPAIFESPATLTCGLGKSNRRCSSMAGSSAHKVQRCQHSNETGAKRALDFWACANSWPVFARPFSFFFLPSFLKASPSWDLKNPLFLGENATSRSWGVERGCKGVATHGKKKRFPQEWRAKIGQTEPSTMKQKHRWQRNPRTQHAQMMVSTQVCRTLNSLIENALNGALKRNASMLQRAPTKSLWSVGGSLGKETLFASGSGAATLSLM